MGFFQAAHRWGEPKSPPTSLTKICHTYPIMMKLGSYNLPKKIQKMYESRDTSLEFCWHQKFFTGNQQILKYQELHVEIAFWYKNYNSFNHFWVFKDCFNKKDTIFMMSARMGTSGLLKIKVFWNKGYAIIIYVHDVTNKILSCYSYDIADVVMWLW